MQQTRDEKRQVRREMAEAKRRYPAERLAEWSAQIQAHLEGMAAFRRARTIACYYALPGEVQTEGLIRKWYGRKAIALPVVRGEDLWLLPYAGADSVQTGAFGIREPKVLPASVSIEKEVELVVVPGVAFDLNRNRLGRGKGFYDRLLATLPVPTVGLCYGFQLRESLPVEAFDRKMDWVITEEGVIG